MNSKKDNKKGIYNEKLEKYIQKEQAAVNLINFTGKLLYEKGVELVLLSKNFLSVKKTEDVSWNELKPMVISHLNHYFENNLSDCLENHRLNLG